MTFISFPNQHCDFPRVDAAERAVFLHADYARAAQHTALCFPMQNEPGQQRAHELEPPTPLRRGPPVLNGPEPPRARRLPPLALCFPMRNGPEPPATFFPMPNVPGPPRALRLSATLRCVSACRMG